MIYAIESFKFKGITVKAGDDVEVTYDVMALDSQGRLYVYDYAILRGKIIGTSCVVSRVNGNDVSQDSMTVLTNNGLKAVGRSQIRRIVRL